MNGYAGIAQLSTGQWVAWIGDDRFYDRVESVARWWMWVQGYLV